MLSESLLSIGIMLEAVEEAPPLDAVEIIEAQITDALGAEHVALLLVSLSDGSLVSVSHVAGSAATAGRNERREGLGTTAAHEDALFSQAVVVNPNGDSWTVLVPVSERGDVIGLLEVSLGDKPDHAALDYLVATAHALAYVLVAVRRYTDLFEWAQRDTPFSVSAELQRRLLPSAYTAETGAVTLAGWLEPSSNAGGDTFDYSLDREYLYLSLTDAMGHSVKAALLATLAVGTFRNRRRALATPAAQAQAADDELQANSTPEQFVTGLIARLHLDDGALEIVNAGHPAPYLVRDGRAEALKVSTHPPLGTGLGRYSADTLRLQAGDRLVMVTDGYLDRRAALVDIEAILAASGNRHPRQVVQELASNVLAVTGGSLRDDATVLCVDYYGPEGQRNASGGASQNRTTRL